MITQYNKFINYFDSILKEHGKSPAELQELEKQLTTN